MPRGGGKSTEDNATDAGGATEAATLLSMIELLREQQRTMMEQQQEQQCTMLEQQRPQQELMQSFINQHKMEMTAHHEEMAALLHKATEVEERAKVRVHKPTLQKLSTEDNIEDFLITYERVAVQQGWPQDVWAVQLAGLLSGKAMAAHTSLAGNESGDYEKVKTAILQRYEVNEETHQRKFRQDKKCSDESYREFVNRLQDRLQR